jgi:hypothetical protein
VASGGTSGEEDEQSAVVCYRDRVILLTIRMKWVMVDDHLLLHPGEFVEQLIPAACRLLNSLLAATPVERLSGVDLDALDLSPSNAPQNAFNVKHGQRIRMQLGL